MRKRGIDKKDDWLNIALNNNLLIHLVYFSGNQDNFASTGNSLKADTTVRRTPL